MTMPIDPSNAESPREFWRRIGQWTRRQFRFRRTGEATRSGNLDHEPPPSERDNFVSGGPYGHSRNFPVREEVRKLDGSILRPSRGQLMKYAEEKLREEEALLEDLESPEDWDDEIDDDMLPYLRTS